LKADPACMPNGGLCDQGHKCCSGAPCCNGFCGSSCVGSGQACDDLHVCCHGQCTGGKCPTDCITSGQACKVGSDYCCNPLGDSASSLPYACTANYCHQSGHTDNEELCNITGAGCGDGLICLHDYCHLVLGCRPRGFSCTSGGDCCSGQCGTADFGQVCR
jgi:hypothetical protein